MNYHFHTMNFSKGRKKVRIHFDDDKYQGLERFFNDDGTFLFSDVEDLLQDNSQEGISIGGNRTIISIYADHLEIWDQWDENTQGYFNPVELSKESFKKVLFDWKKYALSQI